MSASNTDEEQLRSVLRSILRLTEANHNLRQLAADVATETSLITAVIHCYEAHQEISLMVAFGPSDHLVDYLIELDRLDDAQKYLKRIHVDDEQMCLGKTFNIGLQKLIEESDRIITQYSVPIDPQSLLNLCRSTSNESVYTDVLEVSKLGSFRIIFDWFQERGFQQGLLGLYASTRGRMICESLERLAKHLGQERVRRPSFIPPSVSPRLLSPRSSFHADMLPEQMRTTITRLRHRLHRSPVFRHRERSSPKTASFLSPNIDDDLDSSDTDDTPSIVQFNDERETNNYKFLLDAFVVLLVRESDLIVYAFSGEFTSLILTKLITEPMEHMRKETEKLCSAITNLPNKIYNGKYAFHGLISIIRWFHKPKPNLIKFYEENALMPEQDFDHMLLPDFENAVMKYLRAMLVELQNESAALSPGGQVHPLTMHILDFIVEYLDCEHIIVKMQENLNATPSTVKNDPLDLNTYIADLYRALCTHIFEKIAMSVRHDDRIVRAVFLLNNANYILTRIESSYLTVTMEKIQPNLKTHLEEYMRKGIHIYVTCCAPLITAMQQMFRYDDSHHLSTGHLKDCDRDQLKENFSTVNAAIDTFRRENQHLLIEDVQLRDQLQAESRKLVLDMYKTYHTKFAHMQFTRNPERYIRYNPGTLEKIIESFFERC